jgi:hypothetical protein
VREKNNWEARAMVNFTPEERKVVLFLLGLTLSGLVLNNQS